MRLVILAAAAFACGAAWKQWRIHRMERDGEFIGNYYGAHP